MGNSLWARHIIGSLVVKMAGGRAEKGADYIVKSVQSWAYRNPWGKTEKPRHGPLVHKYTAQQSERELFVKTGHKRARTRQTRSCHSVCKDRPARKYSFAVRSVEHWNKLPEKVRASPKAVSPSKEGPKDTISDSVITSVVDPWHFGVDPDPRIHASD